MYVNSSWSWNISWWHISVHATFHSHHISNIECKFVVTVGRLDPFSRLLSFLFAFMSVSVYKRLLQHFDDATDGNRAQSNSSFIKWKCFRMPIEDFWLQKLQHHTHTYTHYTHQPFTHSSIYISIVHILNGESMEILWAQSHCCTVILHGENTGNHME